MKGLGVVAVYHADLAQAQADPALAALMGRHATSTPFDRLAWLELLTARLPATARAFVAVARDGAALAALPLMQDAGGLHPLANWYSFTARPLCTDRARAPALMAAIARSLTPAGALRLWPMPGAEAHGLAQALAASGWIVASAPCDTNHALTVSGRSFAQFWATRPGALRETVRRKGRKGTVAIRIATAFDADDWDAYETVYRRSWKPGEGAPELLRRFARAEGAAGALRLGLATIAGQPVAAQFWTVEGGTAFIHKLAHDETARAHSPGTLLSAAMFARAIDEDGVDLIDFGTGDDPYKRDWTDTVRPRWRIEACRPGAVRHWPALARLSARRMLGRATLVPAAEAG